MLEATVFNTPNILDAGYTSNISGIDTLVDLENFLNKSECKHGRVWVNGKIAAVWSAVDGLQWFPGMNPFTETVSETVISLERSTRLIDEPVERVQYSQMTDEELKAYILGKMQTSNAWLRKAVLALYERQTLAEQQSEQTTQHNGVGFNGTDAPFLSSIAKKIEARRYSLSENQLSATRRAMAKYAGQLVRITRENYPKA